MKFFVKIFMSICILFIATTALAEEISLTENDMPFINKKSNDFIVNIDINSFNNEINDLMVKNHNCDDFRSQVRKIYPEEYIKNRCIFKYSYEAAREKGFSDATFSSKDKDYISKVNDILSEEDYQTEGVANIIYQLKNINPIYSEDIEQCKYITNPYSEELQSCLKKIYTTENNSFTKYMQACDAIYKDKRDSDICIVNLGNKSFDPFDRVETKCLVENYLPYTDKQGNVRRRLNTGPYYQCLSYREKGSGFILWKAQMGYREGYTAGLYILKTNKFDFLTNNNG